MVFWPDKDVSLLPSVSRSGMTLEIGPIAHSTCDSLLLHKTKRILFDIFDVINRMNSAVEYESNFNQHGALYPPTVLRYNERFATIGYPRDDNGNIVALIHPKWQRVSEMIDLEGPNRNFFGSLESRDTPLFQRIDDGSDICIDFSTNVADNPRFKILMGDNYSNFEGIHILFFYLFYY